MKFTREKRYFVILSLIFENNVLRARIQMEINNLQRFDSKVPLEEETAMLVAKEVAVAGIVGFA